MNIPQPRRHRERRHAENTTRKIPRDKKEFKIFTRLKRWRVTKRSVSLEGRLNIPDKVCRR